MELHDKILCDLIARAVIPSLHIDSAKLVEMRCYQAIRKIQQILADDTLEDPECFLRIEKIVTSLEDLGINGEGRHDF